MILCCQREICEKVEVEHNRANIVIVTKCPAILSLDEQNDIKNKLQLNSNQELYFSYIDYDDSIYSEDKIIESE